MITRTIRASTLVVVLLAAKRPESALAHGIAVGRSAEGQLRAVVEVPMPCPLPPSPFPGIDGFADAEPGIASLEKDFPDEDFFQLDPNCDIQFELIGTDPGLQVVTSHVWVPGETLEFGPPVFDFHLVFNIVAEPIGPVYALQFRVHDLSGIYTDSSIVTVFFTAVANACLCRGDLDVTPGRSGADVQSFVDCFLSSVPGDPIEAACACADMDADGALDELDIDLFVARLVSGDPCP